MSISGVNILVTNSDPVSFGTGCNKNLILAANEEVIIHFTRNYNNVTLGTNAILRVSDRLFIYDTLTLDDGAQILAEGHAGENQTGGQGWPSSEFAGGSDGANAVISGGQLFGNNAIPTGSGVIPGLGFQIYGGVGGNAETLYDAAGNPASIGVGATPLFVGGTVLPQPLSTRFNVQQTFGQNALPYGLTLKNYPFGFFLPGNFLLSPPALPLANQPLVSNFPATNFKYFYPRDINYPISIYIAGGTGSPSGFNSAATPSVYSSSGSGGGGVLFISARKIKFNGTGVTPARFSVDGGDAGDIDPTGFSGICGAAGGAGAGFMIIITQTPLDTLIPNLELSAKGGAAGTGLNQNQLTGALFPTGTGNAGGSGQIQYYLIKTDMST